MCGIVGYIQAEGEEGAASIVVESLRRVEYRGYDSVGIAIVGPDELEIFKEVDPEQGLGIDRLAAVIQARQPRGHLVLGHTRWATHGDINRLNAHPHLDCAGRVAVAHNGQIDQYVSIKTELERQGHRFTSETDTECIAHLIERFLGEGDDLLTAVQKTALIIREGAFAFVAIDRERPDELVGACLGSELYLGPTERGSFLTSDHRAFAQHTQDCITIDDGQVVLVRRDGVRRITTFDNVVVPESLDRLWYELGELEKGPYSTFMEAEINFQARMIPRILDGRVTDDGRIVLGGIQRNPAFRTFARERLRRIIFLACGTSRYAGDVLERFAHELGFDARSINAGEYATSPMRADADTLAVPISQSGTTAEVIRAVTKAQREGAVIWPIVNVPGSRLSRFGRGQTKEEPLRGLYLQAGLETGVASTKAFSAQILNGSLFLLALASLQGRVSNLDIQSFCASAHQLSAVIERILARSSEYQAIGAAIVGEPLYLYIGKGYAMPVAEEGALKFKEIVYPPAYGHSASDLKHGPIAMLDEKTWVVSICLKDPEFPDIYDWTIKNTLQVLSRKGKVIMVAEEGDTYATQLGVNGNAVRYAIEVPRLRAPLAAIAAVIPLQLLALGAAKQLGRPIDKPRHLAKSATVY